MTVELAPSSVVVEQIDINLLKPHPRNVEIYGDEDVMDLQQSIAESGWIKPLTATPEYVIVGGHRRYRVGKALGYATLPVVIEAFASPEAEMERLLRENENRGKTPEQQIREGMTWEPIETEKAKNRAIAAHATLTHTAMKNFTGLESGNVRDIIARRVGLGSGVTYEKGKAVVERIDMELRIGDYHRYAEILRSQLNEQSITSAWNTLDKIVKAEEKERLDQEQAEEAARLKAQQLEEELKKIETMPDRGITPGSWWKLGQHLLYCGDSSSGDFKDKLKDAHATFAFADPPYNAGVEEWDHNFEWNHDYLTEVAPVVAVTPGISAIDAFMNKKKMPYYKWSMSYWINNGMTRGALGFGNWMYVALFSDQSLYRNEQDLERIDPDEQWDQDKEAISISGGDQDPLKHKGRKPINLMKHIVEMFTKQEETVIDPFLGTGTTLIACELLGRACVGAELSVEYCESIIKRWEAVSGQQAEEVK